MLLEGLFISTIYIGFFVGSLLVSKLFIDKTNIGQRILEFILNEF